MSKRRRREDGDRERGQIIVLFALVLVVILVFASLVIDIGVLRNDRQTLVNTLDSAALAGGTLLPVNGSAEGTTTNNLIVATINANYPGLPSSAYTISYKCLIGLDSSAPPKPYISRDIPSVCDPTHSLGHAPPVVGDFMGAGSTRYSSCDPSVGDKCNVVMVTGAADTPYSFGRVVGVNSGSTGTVVSAACNGPCGTSPVIPVDVVVIMDRTLSMSGNGPGTDIAAIQGGASAVLQVFDPALQRVALGTIGPSGIGTASCPNTFSAWKNTQVYGVGQSNVNDFTTLGKWVPLGFSGMDAVMPAVTFKESYSSGGVVNTSSTLWKAISCLTSFTAGTNLDTPVAMAQQYLQTYGRPGVKKGIILETDGTPQAGDGSIHYTCVQANSTATTAKAAGIEIFTIGYDVTSAACPTKSGGGNSNVNESTAWAGKPATQLLTSMATDAAHFFNQPMGSDLNAAFKQAALVLAKGGSHLVQLYPLPVVASVSPTSGTRNGGTIVTINGSFLTGATSVSFGGSAASFSLINDTTISATAPAGTVGQTVDIRVTTPGGTSTAISADHYTYN